MIYLELFWVFCKIGAVTFGGGYAMISLIQNEVISRNWCSAAEFADMVSLSQMTPGPIALNTATYVGKVTAGIPGALVATFGLIFPALIFSSLAIAFLDRVKRSHRAEPFIRGIRAGAIGLIGGAVLFFMENSIFSAELPLNLFGENSRSWSDIVFYWQGALIFIVIMLLRYFVKLKPLGAIFISLGLGMGIYSFFPL